MFNSCLHTLNIFKHKLLFIFIKINSFKINFYHIKNEVICNIGRLKHATNMIVEMQKNGFPKEKGKGKVVVGVG